MSVDVITETEIERAAADVAARGRSRERTHLVRQHQERREDAHDAAQPLAPLMASAMRKAMTKDLARLRELLERRPAVPRA